jgi:2-C-methyl-D-erythritol 4-phosphate cytidylyltransferase
MKRIAIIPAGGSGSRFNSPIPKQYVKVLGNEIISYTLKTFQNSSFVDEIIIAAEMSYFETLNQIKKKYGFDKISRIVQGGKERQDSVYNSLISGSFSEDDLMIVHDAARPLLTDQLLEKAIAAAEEHDSIAVAIRARDTLLKGKDHITEYINRDEIYYAQTPQIFRYEILKKAFEFVKISNFVGTDESMIVKKAGFDVRVVEGDFKNFKITTESDLEIFEKLIDFSE